MLPTKWVVLVPRALVAAVPTDETAPVDCAPRELMLLGVSAPPAECRSAATKTAT